MTFRELERLARLEIVDYKGMTAEHFRVKPEQMLAYFNEAEVEACIRARLLIDSATPDICTIDLVAGQSVYPVDSRIIAILRGIVAGADRPLCRSSFSMMDDRVPGWQSKSGEPLAFVTGMGKGVIRLYPTPATSGTLNLTVARQPLAEMRQGSTPEISDRHHAGLILWVKHKIYNNTDSELFDRNRSDIHLAEFTVKFGSHTAELFDLCDAMQIPEFTPDVTRITVSSEDSAYY